MKNVVKYLLVVLLAIAVNFLLWKLGGDCLSNKIDKNTNQSILVWLNFLGILALIVIGIMRWIISWFDFIPKNRKSKLILAVLGTILVFGNRLFLNSKSLILKVFTSNNERIELCNKVHDANYLAHGTRAENLTFKEYNQIRNLVSLPEISNKSYEISYLYSYDGFLPDYILEVTYKLPKDIEVETFEEEGIYDYESGRQIEEFENYNLVVYSEYKR